MNTDPGRNSVDPGLLAIPKTHRRPAGPRGRQRDPPRGAHAVALVTGGPLVSVPSPADGSLPGLWRPMPAVC